MTTADTEFERDQADTDTEVCLSKCTRAGV
jgi:hypothetical protein